MTIWGGFLFFKIFFGLDGYWNPEPMLTGNINQGQSLRILLE
jgi:hypothetical protein